MAFNSPFAILEGYSHILLHIIRVHTSYRSAGQFCHDTKFLAVDQEKSFVAIREDTEV